MILSIRTLSTRSRISGIVLGAIGCGLASLDIVLVPAVALPAFILCLVAAVVLFEPKMAYLLLPITVPWGSLVSLSAGPIPITPTDVAVAALLAAYVIQAPTSPDFALPVNPWLLSLALLILTMVLSMAESASLIQSMKEIVKWLEVLVAASLAPVYVKSARDIFLIVAFTVGSASGEAALGLAQFWLHLGPRSFEVGHRFLRAYGTFGQPNPMAGYLNMIAPIAFAVGHLTRRYWYVLAGTLIALGSIATLSRSGWAALLLALLTMAAIRLPVWRKVMVSLSVLVALITGLSAIGIVPTGIFTKVLAAFGLTAVNFHHFTSANFSEVERAAHWVAGLRMFDAHPFVGVGIGNYPIDYAAFHVGRFVHSLGHAHNYFINIAAECGILGLVAFTLFVLTGFRTCARIYNSATGNPFLAGLALGILGLWISSTFHNLFDVLYVHELPVLVGVLLGLLIAARRVLGVDSEVSG